MRFPIRIFSDLHLGHTASRIDEVEKLRLLFRGAGTVIFNGDTWQELSPPWRERSSVLLEKLKKLLQEEGCEAIFLPGNHDPSWEEKACLILAGGKLAITHGDAMMRNGAPWKREMLSNPQIIEELWEKFPHASTDLDERLALAQEIARRLPTVHPPKSCNTIQRVLDAVYPPQRSFEIIRSWFLQASYAADFCDAYLPQAEFMIYGHFHRCGLRKIRGKVIINTGSFVLPGAAKYVEWDGERLAFGKVDESGTHFTFDSKPSLYALSE